MKIITFLLSITTTAYATLLCLIVAQLASCEQQQQLAPNFPGVSRDLANFCAARPSLPIDLASMVVHVKKNVSFNYKLYLFSGENVFQTGQVIPRDDFRIHSFPVALKRINEFWPESAPTYQFKTETATTTRNELILERVPSEQFSLKQFLKYVPLNPHKHERNGKKAAQRKARTKQLQQPKEHRLLPPDDAHGDALPGDPTSFISHDVARVLEARLSAAKRKIDDAELENEDEAAHQSENFNKHIQFDSDDEVASVRHRSLEHSTNSRASDSIRPNEFSTDDMLIPVGSFSSFHVNLTYLVRKDFGQIEPSLIRIQIDSSKFLVTQVLLINNGTNFNSTNSYSQSEDYRFLRHKMLRDPNTRITSINQIYEDWITRNFYTIVYIQRRLDEINRHTDEQTIVNDRLVFRGTSVALLGADQLDYSVKAAAFITEKNGLHYYLEFLTTNKFYLCAVDWSKRPFKIFDSRQFPLKVTKSQLDNEELLLCPPAVCYSSQPVDEIISYGRMMLPDGIQRQFQILSSTKPQSALSLAITVNSDERDVASNETVPMNYMISGKRLLKERQVNLAGDTFNDNDGSLDAGNNNGNGSEINLANASEALKSGSRQLQTKLHLRDWVWILPRSSSNRNQDEENQREASLNSTFLMPSFEWRYELARRNDIKAKPDGYGYVLTGHDIDAAYRVYNELYLITANHLITINYTMPNETVISTHSVGDDFFGLSSNLIDPITGAYYDRHSNEIYFFKGDRYIGYDYASKKPLKDFLLLTPSTSSDYLNLEMTSDETGGAKSLVSSLPVVGILGRQHQVDGIYHDFPTDLVYIFSGMKFYTFEANEFKNGTFKSKSRSLPQMYCINEYFLDGCHFDKAFQNPCHSKEEMSSQLDEKNDRLKASDVRGYDDESDTLKEQVQNGTSKAKASANKELADFNEEQQMRLRSIAVKPLGLLNLLVENTILRTDAAKAVQQTSANFESQSRAEKVVIYLLMAMVLLTVLVTIVMTVVLINWTRVKLAAGRSRQQQQQLQLQVDGELGFKVAQVVNHASRNHHYLSNQQQQQSRRHPFLHTSYHVGRDDIVRAADRSTQGPSTVMQAKSLAPQKGIALSSSGRGLGNDDIDNSVL